MSIRTTKFIWLLGLSGLAILTTAVYGLLLYKFTKAASPFLDSAILAFSVLGQFLSNNLPKIENNVPDWVALFQLLSWGG